MEEEEVLRNHYLLFKHIMSRHGMSIREDYDDAFQCGLIGALKGLRSFQEGKGSTLASFLGLCFERRISSYKRDHAVQALPEGSISMNATLKMSQESNVLHNGEKQAEEGTDDVYPLEILENFKFLTDLEKQALQLRLAGYTLKEIGKIAGRSAKCADNALSRAREKLRSNYYK